MNLKVKSVTLIIDRQGQPITGTFKNEQFYTSIVEFEDGQKGNYDHPEPLADYFIPGAQVECTIESKGSWNKLRKPGGTKSGYSGGGGGKWVPKTIQEVKRDAVIVASRHVTDMIVIGVVAPGQYPDLLRSVMKAICAEIDRIQ